MATDCQTGQTCQPCQPCQPGTGLIHLARSSPHRVLELFCSDAEADRTAMAVHLSVLTVPSLDSAVCAAQLELPRLAALLFLGVALQGHCNAQRQSALVHHRMGVFAMGVLAQATFSWRAGLRRQMATLEGEVIAKLTDAHLKEWMCVDLTRRFPPTRAAKLVAWADARIDPRAPDGVKRLLGGALSVMGVMALGANHYALSMMMRSAGVPLVETVAIYPALLCVTAGVKSYFCAPKDAREFLTKLFYRAQPLDHGDDAEILGFLASLCEHVAKELEAFPVHERMAVFSKDDVALCTEARHRAMRCDEWEGLRRVMEQETMPRAVEGMARAILELLRPGQAVA